jgi:tetratricopeptide (TPR) repeat protein
VEFLEKTTEAPGFVWVHYFDPHAPYEPPDEFRREYGARPYYGEIAAMDEQLGRLIRAFDEHAARAGVEPAFLVVADHGEGLGDHGESQHGNLLYQATIHVPLIAAGPGFPPGMSSEPVSTRRVFHTLLDWARLEGANSLHSPTSDVVAAEAMKPFLNYGWQPQIMAVEGHRKAIFAGRTEVYDIAVDPAEARDLGGGTALSTAMRKVLDEYPVPASAAGSHDDALSNDARRALASLGYVSATATPVVRKDAPRPADMVRLFERIERASALFVAERYGEVIPLLNDIVKEDPNNLDAVLRLATAYSSLGREADALAAFARARTLAPESQDVRLYLALHYARGQDWARAVPELERIVAATPERVPALEALARIRERQGRIAEAVAIRTKVYGLRDATAAELIRQGEQAMSIQATDVAIDAFERARTRDTRASPHDLELGVLYLSVRKYDAARNALDRVPATHPDYPMALFKRAQVSVLLNEPDAPARIEAARRHADSTTRTLIAREKLFTAVR